MMTPSTPDIDLVGDGGRRIPCEYRLLHIASGKFVCNKSDGTVDTLCEDWREADYFQSCDHHKGHEEGTLEFQWAWARDEADHTWMANANMNDYRVHVLIGESGC